MLRVFLVFYTYRRRLAIYGTVVLVGYFGALFIANQLLCKTFDKCWIRLSH